MTTALISLGGNLGDIAATIGRALQRLHQPPEVCVVLRSSLFRTKPVGTDAGAEFVNAAAVLETSLTAHELFDRLLTTETEFHRVREIHWGPRTLDLDLLCFGDAVIDDQPKLRVPHPACWYRRFVLDPLVEIAPQFVHPEKGVTMTELRRRLTVRPLPVYVLNELSALDPLAKLWQAKFPQAALRMCHEPHDMPEVDEGLVIQLLSGQLPVWTEPLSHHIGWLDARQIPGDREQCFFDLMYSAGL